MNMKIILFAGFCLFISCTKQKNSQQGDKIQPDTIMIRGLVLPGNSSRINDILLLKTDSVLFDSFFETLEKQKDSLIAEGNLISFEITKSELKELLDSIAINFEDFKDSWSWENSTANIVNKEKCHDLEYELLLQYDGLLVLSKSGCKYYENWGYNDCYSGVFFNIKNSKIEDFGFIQYTQLDCSTWNSLPFSPIVILDDKQENQLIIK